MKTIKNIIFDFGGVLLSEDDEWVRLNDTRNLLNVSQGKLFRGWDAAWPEAKVGKITEDEFFEKFLRASVGHSDKLLISKLKEIYRNNLHTNEAYKLLPPLKGRYKLFALTNITKEWLKLKKEKYNLSKFLELVVSSCEEGVAKPNSEIYEILIKKASLKPGESVFIDNLHVNLPPAKDLGFATILYKDKDSLIKEFQKLKITI